MLQNRADAREYQLAKEIQCRKQEQNKDYKRPKNRNAIRTRPLSEPLITGLQKSYTTVVSESESLQSACRLICW
jgi:hypothetical protein